MKRARSGKRILIAETTDFYRLMLGEFLRSYGYDVVFAASQAELAEVAPKESCSLLILDPMLSTGSTSEFLDQLRRIPSLAKIPVIITVSFRIEESEVERMRQKGIVSFANKAVPIEEILTHINALIFPREKDLRKSPRAQVSIPVSYEVDGRRFESQTFNLSRDGMFVVTIEEAPPPPNSRLRLRFWLPNSEAVIACQGLVIWCNNYGARINELYPPGMGVMFADPKPEQTDIINRYVRDRLKTLFP